MSNFFVCKTKQNVNALKSIDLCVVVVVYNITYESSFVGLDERTVVAVHLVVETACVAQVVAICVAAPQRCVRRSTVDALASIYTYNK